MLILNWCIVTEKKNEREKTIFRVQKFVPFKGPPCEEFLILPWLLHERLQSNQN